MRVNRTLLSAFAAGITGGVLMAACQTYDFEPVELLALAQTTVGNVVRAKAAKPNLMVLLDTSGSMMLPVNPSLAACRDSSGTVCGQPNNFCDVNTCPTRWSDMRGAMSSFLTSSGTIARMGLTTYPAATGTTATQCLASSAVKIPIPQVDDSDTDALRATATQIAQEIMSRPVSNGQQGVPVGGTPTGESLKFVGAQPELQSEERDDFVLLLTDGLPNCNPNNPNAGTANCECGSPSCGTSPLVCLDRESSVAAVRALEAQKIRTIVIGFGAETAAGAGPATLNAMAEAGGFARSQPCTSDAVCGAGDTCNQTTKLCNRRFYQAANQDELRRALEEIINRVGNEDPCLLKLDPAQRPSDDSLIVVYVNGQSLPKGPDNWELNDAGVKFLGQTCSRILASSDANPITLEVRAVQRK